jgi:hypothetical protein
LILILLAALQAPDIQLNVDATIRRVTIERSGEASLEVTGGEGSVVRVEAPKANGRRTLRNVRVRVRAEARVADPQNPPATETPPPQ